MPDKDPKRLLFESSDDSERKLWSALGALTGGEPSAHMRRSFYYGLEAAGAQTWTDRLRDWLGLSGQAGWLTTAACVLLGFSVAQLIEPRTASDSDRLAALEDSIDRLNRERVLDRLQADAPATRLLGVHDALGLVEDDRQVVQALLQRAANDRSPSVRSAAIDALAPRLGTSEVGDELMRLLQEAESPLVQLALVDLVLRHGSGGQLRQLARLADDQLLHPDLVRHVRKALGRDSI